MLVTLTLSVVMACSSDDDEISGAADYTSDEIVELLTGKWEISGEVRISEPIGGKSQTNYTGTIEFKANQKYNVSNTILFEDGDTNLYLSDILNNYRPYVILRKNGKNYIQVWSAGSLVVCKV